MKVSRWIALAMVWLAAGAMADVIVLTDGKRQEGIVIKDIPGDKTITIRTAAGDIAIPRDKISTVQRESAAESYAHIAEQYFARNEIAKAYDAYKKAAEADPNNTTVTAGMQKVEAAYEQLQASKQREQLQKTDEMLQQAVALAEQGKFDDANRLLKAADPGENSPRTDAYRRAFARVYYLWGQSRLDHQDTPGAQEKLEIAMRLDPHNDDIRKALLKVWEGDPTKLETVIDQYKNSTRPEDELKVADALFKLKRYDEALPIYLKYLQEPKYATETMRQRVYVMFDQLHRQYADKGDFKKAIEAYKLFLQFSPNEPATPLARYEYMLRRSQVNPNNPEERAQLAKFAEDHGLVDVAKEEYRNVLAMDPTNKTASEGLRRFAEADLKDAMDFLTEQQFLLAAQKAQEVQTAYAIFPDIIKQADEIVTKAKVEQQRMVKDAKQQAVALAMRGDDYYNQALSYIAAYTSTNLDQRKRVFSPKQEAAKNLERAIYAWQQALKLDPSLGAPTSYDLHNKIADAYAKYSVLTNPNPPPAMQIPQNPLTVRRH
jgi:tetratricopeptide (TPR) repeat protein